MSLRYFMIFIDNFDITSKETRKELSSLEVVEDLFIKVLNYGGPSNTNEFSIDKKFAFIESFVKRKNCSVPDLLQVFYIIKKKSVMPDVAKLSLMS